MCGSGADRVRLRFVRRKMQGAKQTQTERHGDRMMFKTQLIQNTVDISGCGRRSAHNTSFSGSCTMRAECWASTLGKELLVASDKMLNNSASDQGSHQAASMFAPFDEQL
jgi:hypothetical protein